MIAAAEATPGRGRPTRGRRRAAGAAGQGDARVLGAADHRAVDDRRDEAVRTAAEAGLTKSEIRRLTGVARGALDRILGTGGGGQP